MTPQGDAERVARRAEIARLGDLLHDQHDTINALKASNETAVAYANYLTAELSRLTSDAEQMHRENAELEVVNARLVTEIERLTAVLAAREEQCHGLAEAAMNNGQQLLLFERALERIVELKYSEAGEPFDDAIDIAEKALAARPTPAAAPRACYACQGPLAMNPPGMCNVCGNTGVDLSVGATPADSEEGKES